MESKSISEKDIREAIAGIKHPAIDSTLLELGIIKTIIIENGQVNITLAFPFPNIPIQDHLINSVRGPVAKLGVELEIKVTVMTHEELQRFLALEQEHWKQDM